MVSTGNPRQQRGVRTSTGIAVPDGQGLTIVSGAWNPLPDTAS